MEKAKANNLANQGKVTDVVKKFREVERTYYQMLITYRIKKKANAFHGAANTLKDAATQAAGQGTPLGKLQEAASQEMDELATKAQDLKDNALGAHDSQIVDKYLAVVQKYKALKTKPEFKAAEKVREVQQVKKKFKALQKSYENVLKLRVQELADKAEKLKTAADKIKDTALGLTKEATALANAASNSVGGNSLKEKATKLVDAINSSSGDPEGTNATEVIEQFEAVRTAYDALAGQPTYSAVVEKIKKGQPLSADEQNVKDVYDAYNDLKNVYDTILNVKKSKLLKDQVGDGTGSDGKIWDKAKDLYEKANNLASAEKLQTPKEQGAQDPHKELRDLATILATAVGESTNSGLQQALSALKTATETNTVEKAQDVVTKYNAVKSAYEKVTAKEKEYKDALGEGETNKYTNVTSAFQALQFCQP